LIDLEGKWSAIGFYNWEDSKIKSVMYEAVDDNVFPETFYFVNVEVPLPEVGELKGKIEDNE
jgi:hypothetical protein